MNLPLKNSNGTQSLLTKTALRGVPALYAQDGLGLDAVAHLRFFIDGFTWYVSEIDPTTGQAFGKVVSSAEPHGELGYICMRELASLRGSIGHGVERDLYFSKTKLADCK